MCVLNAYDPAKKLCDPRDGRTYKYVEIGDQTWMAENMKRYIDNYYTDNGTKVYDYCYERSLTNCERYGGLYSWNEVTYICPEGWRLPDDNDWASLMETVGTSNAASLKATNGWNPSGTTDGNGTDDYGFAALPGGYGYYYTTTQNTDSSTTTTYNSLSNSGVGLSSINNSYNSKSGGYNYYRSVRCIKN